MSDVLIHVVLASVLALVVLSDMRRMRIPDTLSVVLLAIYALSLLVVFPGWTAVMWQLGLAVAVFVLGFAGFALRLVGGGDVKILTTLALFVPLQALPHVMLTFSASLVLCTAGLMLVRRWWRGAPSGWAALTSRKMPMGLPIGVAGLACIGTAALG